MTRLFSIFLSVVSWNSFVIGNPGIDDAKQLLDDLFTLSTYNTILRPINNQSNAIDVYISFSLVALNNVDEVGEIMKTTGFLNVSWQDEMLTWTPALYSGIVHGFYPQNDVWKPDIALLNSAVPYKPLGDATLKVLVLNTGDVSWSPFQVFESTCSISITYFPFDIQTCHLEFVPWSYGDTEITVYGDPTVGIDLSLYQTNPAWDIVDSYTEANFRTVRSSIRFTLELKRKPQFFLLPIVLPIFLLTFLNIFTFMLPSEGGEKTGYAVTIFLAFAVFLTIVESTLPENSESVSLFSVYIFVMAFMSCLITVVTLIQCRVCSWDNKEKPIPIPRWLKFVGRLGRGVYCKQKCCEKNNQIHGDPDTAEQQKR